MKNILIIGFLALILSGCQEQQKIAFIDNGKIINDYQEKKDIEEKYKAKDEVFTKRTDSISQAFQLEAQDFQLKSKSMSQKQAQAKYDELGQKQQLLQQQLQFEQQQIQQAFNAEIDSVILKVKDYVKGYGERKGYTYILGTTEASSSVMYGKDENDLTQIILDSLNSMYKKN
ncbi:MAG: OmpH family outer membrane protein [Flavobacteriaceae bacterium]|nr:OmpH family outer membrane protein [Bacteroidia bacterium]MBT8286631.1 OmpH family outer membrane protein [Bacteroidia bacterium]NNF75156.1 OmpH family outer membrane protein [Flavobacteriaceae bacterium]NNK72172.1 OmpH family outer membrane protein [Flavobacteriaceae bacterium]